MNTKPRGTTRHGTDTSTETTDQTPPAYDCPYSTGDPVYEHYDRAGTYGFMHAAEYDWSNVECTKRAYGDNTRSLMFHTEWMDVSEAIECLHVLEGEYADTFDAGEVIDVLRRFDGDSTRVVVGRECSPVIYVWTPAVRTLGQQLNELEMPPEYGAEVYPDTETFPKITVGDPIEEIGFGVPVLLKAWWD